MSQEERQETKEYYQWLICLERQQIEEELLEIVSSSDQILISDKSSISGYCFSNVAE